MDTTIYEIMIVDADGEPLLEGNMGKSAVEQTLLDYHLCYDRPHVLMVQAVAEEGFSKLPECYHLFIKQVRS